MPDYGALFTGEMAGEESPSPQQEAAYRILLVDDEPNVLKALQRVFAHENYRIVTAGSGQQALALLDNETFQLMITDYKMPGMTGGELIKQARERYPDMLRIMLTGHADTSAVMSAIKEGAVYKFILKPWNDDDLRVSVGLAMEQYDLIQKNRALQQNNEAKSREINALSKLAVTNRSQLAIMLHKRGLLNDAQAQEVYKLQQSRKEPVIKLLLEKEWVAEKQLRNILRQDLMIEEVALDEFQIDPSVLALIPRSFCERQLVMPLRQEGRRLVLVMADPMDMGLTEDLRFSIGLDIQPVMANVESIKHKIHEVYSTNGMSLETMENLVGEMDPYEGIEIVIDDGEKDVSLEELLHSSDEPPAIRLVNAIILEAMRLGASDIHIQPRTKSVVVRYRIDGVLIDKIHIPHALHMSLVSRIKIMSELDITERRRPQDGRVTVKSPVKIVDLRISTLPTISGEKVVMRLLDRNATIHGIDVLGFALPDLKKILTIVDKPQGMILTTGPTGSGKTTTLYSLMQHNASPGKNYVTIEDPVEYYLDMAGQVLVRDKVGLGFSESLRAILRQDPDVILLGEIRDKETAEVAFNAALTGHLVFSTLHTNSAIATIARLFDLGLNPYVIATALEAVVAQRLVRKICEYCREPAEEEEEVSMRLLGPQFEPGSIRTFRGRGCPKCGNLGYKGRAGIYEVMVPDIHLQHLIATGSSAIDLAEYAHQSEMTTLIKNARDKVDQGVTTIEEVLRVLGPQVID